MNFDHPLNKQSPKQIPISTFTSSHTLPAIIKILTILHPNSSPLPFKYSLTDFHHLSVLPDYYDAL